MKWMAEGGGEVDEAANTFFGALSFEIESFQTHLLSLSSSNTCSEFGRVTSRKKLTMIGEGGASHTRCRPELQCVRHRPYFYKIQFDCFFLINGLREEISIESVLCGLAFFLRWINESLCSHSRQFHSSIPNGWMWKWFEWMPTLAFLNIHISLWKA